MPTYQVNVSKHATLTANVVDTVTVTGFSDVEVMNRGASVLFFRTDGTAPAVNGDDCYVVPPGSALMVRLVHKGSVKLISDDACDYSVTGV